jgi:hypothetical protein
MLRFFAIYGVAAILLASMLAFFSHRKQAFYEKRIAATDELLNTPVRVEDDRTLGEAINSIRSETALPIIVDWRSLSDEGIRGSTPISIACHDDPMAVVLRRVLRSAAGPSASQMALQCAIAPHIGAPPHVIDLGFYVDEQGNVIVTTSSHIESKVCLYDLSKLIPALNAPEYIARENFRLLIVGVSSESDSRVMDPSSYEKVGAWCSDADEVSFVGHSNYAYVNTTTDGHRRIARLLKRLKNDPKLTFRLYFHRQLYL